MGNDCCAFVDDDEERDLTEADLLRQKSEAVDLTGLVGSNNRMIDSDIYKSKLTKIEILSRRETTRYVLALNGMFPDFELKKRKSLSRRRTASLLNIQSGWETSENEKEKEEEKKENNKENNKENKRQLTNEEILEKKTVVVKQFKQSEIWNRIQFGNEVLILNEIGSHPHCLSLIDTFLDHKGYYIAMSFCRGGSLLDNIVKIDKISERCVANIIRIILDVLKYVHSKDIVHRNLCFR